MRRQNSYFGGVLFAVIAVIVLTVLIVIYASKNNFTKEYANYVKTYEDAFLEYANKDLPSDYSIVYDYDELTDVLISNGYLTKFSDNSVEISSNPITFEKINNKVSFYNYNNSTTLENRFELLFKKGNKEYTCTKIECR